MSSMKLIKTHWAGQESFSMIPISLESPYIECIYNPGAKILAVIGKDKRDKFVMVERLTTEGAPEKSKLGDPQKPHKLQRISQESYCEYYIKDRKDQEEFIKQFAINSNEFDYKIVLDMPMMDAPTEALVSNPIITE